MSYEDRSLAARAKGGEAPFQLDEVFFSRTDDRGVIRAGNHVFSRVANYELGEMLGAPHKLIRHPDMPKGVFQLLWDTIQRGETIGAYVKNRAKDGCYYWVFAVVTPCKGGYLSARIKPSSPILATIQKAYGELRQAEQNEGLSPVGSAARILELVRGLGFDSYQDFAGHALSEELLARDAGLGKAADPRITGLRGMEDNSEQLVQETEGLISDFVAMRTIPQNLRVIASRIEPAGGPVTVLAQNYAQMSREMSNWFEAHVLGEDSNFKAIKGTVNNAMFVEGLARILTECGQQLMLEANDLEGIDIEAESSNLNTLRDRQFAKSQEKLATVEFEAGKITSACVAMHRNFMALTTTRVLCKIESARLGLKGEALDAIIEELGDFQDRISRRLEAIAELAKAIRDTDHKIDA